MEILKLILENWLIFVIVVVLLGLTVYAVLRFLKLTPQQQLDKIRIALLYMVTEAEKELKRKTGQVKRAMVWDWLVERFPIITLFITERKRTDDRYGNLRYYSRKDRRGRNEDCTEYRSPGL